jgi:hypothetical protein
MSTLGTSCYLFVIPDKQDDTIMYRGLPGPGVYCLIDEVDIIRPRGQYYDCSLFVPRRIMNAVQICWSLSLA